MALDIKEKIKKKELEFDVLALTRIVYIKTDLPKQQRFEMLDKADRISEGLTKMKKNDKVI
jgi:hypothetical protein